MAIQLVGGVSGAVTEVGAAAAIPAHITAKPIPYGTLGHYALAVSLALPVSASANGHRFAFRWTHATNLAVLTRIRLFDMQLTAATATIYQGYQAFVARAFTTFHTTSVTNFTFTGNNMKKRASMGTTLAGNIGHSAAVAAGMTGQTATLDAHPIIELGTVQTITTPNTTLWVTEREFDMAGGAHPVVLAQNEGIIVTGPTIVSGAAGTQQLGIEFSWAEVSAF